LLDALEEELDRRLTYNGCNEIENDAGQHGFETDRNIVRIVARLSWLCAGVDSP